jgi:hypothetical protein
MKTFLRAQSLLLQAVVATDIHITGKFFSYSLLFMHTWIFETPLSDPLGLLGK